jgi:hypothetical protein
MLIEENSPMHQGIDLRNRHVRILSMEVDFTVGLLDPENIIDLEILEE